jgi:hypothetical protein
LPFGFSLCFRKGEVGGDRGFEAALADLALAAAASPFEGESRKTNMNIHNTTPTTIVTGFDRRSDRTGPMAPRYGRASPIDDARAGIISQEDMCSRCLEPHSNWILLWSLSFFS